ncbi:MAG: D-alanyl-D-alanine carboxypeptidase/D-alanyl-D-alanine-endopeptidase [Chitinophagaceae bacterium]|nr:MAG: D-alanyl-D-alanine carboxypeptidase/D-alanyl-D-alanine-endopeptidase [Chitinophagaceae bacterium]
MKHFFIGAGLLLSLSASAQSVAEKLKLSWDRFAGDSQLRAGIASICVVDAASGNVVFERNSGIGLAPASSQKVITAATAYEWLGKDFTYKTTLYGDSLLSARNPAGRLYIIGSGDPTLGSWRWKSTSMDSVLAKFTSAVRQNAPRGFQCIVAPVVNWDTEVIPPGWIWDDLGQYYGAGAEILNWHENQFDVILRSGPSIGDPVAVVRSEPRVSDSIASLATAAPAGTGDQIYLYPANNGRPLTVRGTIPVSQAAFPVGAALPDPGRVLIMQLEQSLAKAGLAPKKAFERNAKGYSVRWMATHNSPPLDSIVYWFLRKSINLYGEALIKTFAASDGAWTPEGNSIPRKLYPASTTRGAELLRTFWKERGIDPVELRVKDGSGLSPENRVTTHAQVQVLQYARRQAWFPGFYLALPEYNGMKIKSGTIGGVKAFCGYHTSKAGVTYTVSFIVNNYNDSERSIIQKMYAVLNELK